MRGWGAVWIALASCREPAQLEAPAPVQASPATPEARTLPEGFVDLAIAVPGVRLDIRYATANNFTGAPLPGYAVAGAWMRDDAARALAGVQRELAGEGLGLMVHDAYRPVRATLAMVEWAERSGRRDLLDDGWIARRSMHNVGDAIDLTLCDAASGAVLDMGSPYDAFIPESRVRGVGGEALARRLRLRAAMERAGFAPYETEWWHFTFRRDVRGPALDVPY